MEREFLDVLDYELSISEADLLDLHETLIAPRSSEQATQLHPFFHSSALERAPRPEGGVQMFRAQRVTDEDESEEEGSTSSGSFYGDEVSISLYVDELDSVEADARIEAKSPASSSQDTSTSSGSPSEPSTTATSAFSYHPHMVSKPAPSKDDAQPSVIPRALWLAGHQLISSIPTALPQLAVSA